MSKAARTPADWYQHVARQTLDFLNGEGDYAGCGQSPVDAGLHDDLMRLAENDIPGAYRETASEQEAAQPDALERLAQAVDRQTDLLSQIASALFEIAGQGEEESEEPETYMDGTPMR